MSPRKAARCAGALVAAGALSLVLATASGLRPLPEHLPPSQADVRKARIVDRSGVPLTVTYANDWNVHDRVPLSDVPALLQSALIQAEDKRFHRHAGIDWMARAHALWQNLLARRAVRGASTISEQVVRMLHPRPRTLWTRWLEGWEAMRLEARFSKAAILEFYLNQVPYADRRRGVAQAARHYFDRDLSTLDAREMLALAVLVRSPSRLDLYDDPQALEPRLRRLAQRMRAAGALDARRYASVMTPGFELRRPPAAGPVRHFAEHLYRTLHRERIARTRIVTTLDAHLQARVHGVLAQWRETLASRGVHNAAALVADHRTAEVLAWVNAHAPGAGSAYDAVTVPRQPGSTLKPFVYAAALERGWTAATLIDDAPLREAVGRGQHRYRNYSRSHYGRVRVRDALGNSLNIPAVRAAQFVTPRRVLRHLRRLGFDSLGQHPDFYGDGLALGNGEVTLLELAGAYAALANGGVYRPLSVVRDAPPDRPVRVFARGVAQIIGNILADADARRLEFGSGGSMRFPVETAIKTGTSSDYRDAWAIAFNHRYTVGVWMGNLDGRPMHGITGARGPVPAVRAIIAELNRLTPPRPLPFGEDLVRVDICRKTGLPAAGECPSQPEWFVPGTVPSRVAPQPPRPAPRMRQPSWDLQLAMDPRIPDARERFALEVQDLPRGARVSWFVDGKRIGVTHSGTYLWALRRGRHRAWARIETGEGAVLDTARVPFVVR
ncbi:MAG: penicillin-binding protein 1C [Gammaproteobacteria bacterium]|nr:penicillin-binding protein 1C [Gammaproteobacteria bacterium]